MMNTMESFIPFRVVLPFDITSQIVIVVYVFVCNAADVAYYKS